MADDAEQYYKKRCHEEGFTPFHRPPRFKDKEQADLLFRLVEVMNQEAERQTKEREKE